MGRGASIFFFCAGGLALFSCARAADYSIPVPQTRGEKHMALERQVFALINEYRQDQELPALTWNDAIADTARGHSRDMAEGRVDFGHEGFSDRIGHLREELGRVAGAGENVLFTDDPRDLARSAVTEWLHSPPHLHNIRGNFTCSGIGVWESEDGAIYFTQIFVRLAPAAPPETAAESGVLFPGPVMIVGPGNVAARSPGSN
jgi:uncharacterized protein YkwD